MTIVIAFIGVYMLVCYLYESVLAPFLRYRIRFKMFEQRDEIRNAKIEFPESIDDKTFAIIEDSINAAIALCANTPSPTQIWTEQEFTCIEREIWQRIHQVKIRDDNNVIQTWKAMHELVIWTLIVNRGMLLICLAPLILGWMLIPKRNT